MKFVKTKVKYPAGEGEMFYPVEGVSNYRSVSVITPYTVPPPTGENGEPVQVVDPSKRFYFFEFFTGQAVPVKVPINHMGKKPNAVGQKIFAIEKVIDQMVYTGPQINEPETVARMAKWLEDNTI